jgi:RIO kinase 1
VSQSVEHDHPHAFDFLRSDIRNVDEFFSRRGVRTLGMRRTFDLVTTDWGKDGDETVHEITGDIERRLDLEEEEEGEDGGDREEKDAKRAEEDAVFANSYIPRTLNDVYDAERDVERVMRGEGDDLIYAGITGVAKVNNETRTTSMTDGVEASSRQNGRGVKFVGVPPERVAEEEEGEGGDNDSDGFDASGSESEGDDDEGGRKPKGHKFEDKDAKRVRRFSGFFLKLSWLMGDHRCDKTRRERRQ